MGNKIVLHNLTIPFLHEPVEAYHFTQNGIFFAEAGDAVLLHHPIDKDILSFYQSIAIAPKELTFIVSGETPSYTSIFSDKTIDEQVQRYIANRGTNISLDVFMPTGFEAYFAKKYELVYSPLTNQYEEFVSKSDFKFHASNLRMPTVPGYLRVTRHQLRSVVKQLFEEGKRCVMVKQDDGVSGTCSAVYCKKDEYESYVPKTNVRQSLGHGYVVEAFIDDVVVSPSAQGFIDDTGEVAVLSVHNQLFEAGTQRFAGNESERVLDDSLIATLEQGTKLFGSFLSSLQYRGYFGIDAIYTKERELYYTELNPRRTIPSYAYQIITKLGFSRPTVPWYGTYTYATPSLSGINLLKHMDTLLYDLESRNGIIPLSVIGENGRERTTVLIVAQTKQLYDHYRDTAAHLLA